MEGGGGVGGKGGEKKAVKAPDVQGRGKREKDEELQRREKGGGGKS